MSRKRDIIEKETGRITEGVEDMPVISRFYGIVIRMYFQQAEHNPPHIHAIYGEHTAAIDIQTGEVIEGSLPPKAISMVRE